MQIDLPISSFKFVVLVLCEKSYQNILMALMLFIFQNFIFLSVWVSIVPTFLMSSYLKMNLSTARMFFFEHILLFFAESCTA